MTDAHRCGSQVGLAGQVGRQPKRREIRAAQAKRKRALERESVKSSGPSHEFESFSTLKLVRRKVLDQPSAFGPTTNVRPDRHEGADPAPIVRVAKSKAHSRKARRLKRVRTAKERVEGMVKARQRTERAERARKRVERAQTAKKVTESVAMTEAAKKRTSVEARRLEIDMKC